MFGLGMGEIVLIAIVAVVVLVVVAVVGALILLVCLLLTSLAVVREREIGTLEQLKVSPLSPGELIVGKTLPFAAIGLVDLAVVTGAALWVKDTDRAGRIARLTPFHADEFEATVESVDGRTVVLDRTYFYAESGGQPADRGTLAGVRVEVERLAGDHRRPADATAVAVPEGVLGSLVAREESVGGDRGAAVGAPTAVSDIDQPINCDASSIPSVPPIL